jgi:hypothetical protein
MLSTGSLNLLRTAIRSDCSRTFAKSLFSRLEGETPSFTLARILPISKEREASQTKQPKIMGRFRFSEIRREKNWGKRRQAGPVYNAFETIQKMCVKFWDGKEPLFQARETPSDLDLTSPKSVRTTSEPIQIAVPHASGEWQTIYVQR